MATEKESVIIDIQIEQGDAISELEKLKKGIIQSKQEVTDLTKAYKAGNITLDEYVAETVRLEGILKKQTTTYNSVQKSVTGVKTQLDKLIDSNKKISQSFQEAANNINIAGVNVGQLGAKITSFLNPVTAAVGVVGALGSAYARSTAGAKDLEFAQSQLSASITLLTNDFAELIGTSSEDGEGWVTVLTNSILFKLNPSLALTSRNIALLQEKFEDLARNERLARGEVNELLSENAEKLTIIQDSQTAYNEKVHQVGEILSNINKAEESLLSVLREQLSIAEQRLSANTIDEKLIDERNIILQQISAEERKFAKQREATLRLESNITDQNNKQLEAQRKLREDQEEERRRTARGEVSRRGAGDSGISGATGDIVRLDAKAAAMRVEMAKKTEEQIAEERRQGLIILEEIEQEKLDATQTYLQASLVLTSKFLGEGSAAYKTLAIAQATIDTYRGATAALAPPPVGAGPIFGPALAALTIATGLSNVATISGIAAAGGADFTTKGPTMLIVGDNPGGVEHVSVKPISGKGKTKTWNGGVAAAGGADFIAQGIDGGAAMNHATSEIHNQMMLMNLLKNMPAPIVGVKEITKKQRSVQVKENISRIRGRK